MPKLTSSRPSTRSPLSKPWVSAAVAGLLFAAGCSASEGLDATEPSTRDPKAEPAAGSVCVGDGCATNPQAELGIEPQNPVIATAGMPASVTFRVFLKSDPKRDLTSVQWDASSVKAGSFAKPGEFTASGAVGGKITITARVGDALVSTALSVNLTVREQSAEVDDASKAALDQGGTADPAFRFLYPYDRTVFPRGLIPPTLQWAGTKPSVVKLQIKSAHFDYVGYVPASSNLAIDPKLWERTTESAQGASDPVTVSVTKMVGAAVTGPKAQTWTIAPASVKGAIYYNTYSSPKIAGGAGIMKIRPGESGATPSVVAKGCIVCHSASADGSTLVAADAPSGSSPYDAVSMDLRNAAVELHRKRNDAKTPGGYSFAAVSPTGSRIVPAGTPQMFDAKLGVSKPLAGVPAGITSLGTPSFSPDGKAFTFDLGLTSIHTTRFDPNTDTLSDDRVLVDNKMPPVSAAGLGNNHVSWPAFTPDSRFVVFQVGNRSDGMSYNWYGVKGRGDLFVADTETKTVRRLDALNGLENDKSVLPFGEEEAHLNYMPTVLPVAAGGYYWVVFSSRRQYGNTINDANPYSAPDVMNAAPARRHKLWVAAVDVAAPGDLADKDRSHPAFYLDAQELSSANMRGFWALDPCAQNGNGCGSGDECCSGFCRQTSGTSGSTFTCVDKPKGCAQEFESCATGADCCTSAAACINGRCAAVQPK